MNRWKFGFITVLLALLFVPTGFGQTAQVGHIGGTVKDQTGAVLPGVTVEAKHEEQGFTRSVVTDSGGQFRMPAMPLGNYTVTATLSGFDTATSKHNVVEAEKTTDVRLTMKLGTTTATIEVRGEAPIVDKTNVAAQTKIRAEEFQKLPVGRNYQSLIGLAPGVPTTGGGNVNAHGALSSNNQFLFDGADVTDPTTGTFASNLNFEAIQEISMYTAGVSAEYGRASGAIVNVITKSGGNNFSGSAKLIGTNDKWNEQNKTRNEVCSTPYPTSGCKNGDSLARTKFDHVNPVQSYTLGGPIWRDHAWFFGAYEKSKNTSAQRQTLFTNENYQQTTVSPFHDIKGTLQINPTNNLWIKHHTSPTNGFVIDYWNGAADLGALTGQDQTAKAWTGQWTGVFGSSMTMEALAAKANETITVGTYSLSPLNNGAPHYSLKDRLYFNGATFVGAVDRPRKQFTAALSYFHPMAGGMHNFKVGYDFQDMKSTNVFGFPNNQLFVDNSFDPTTKTFSPLEREDYDKPVASTSKGKINSLYARDKFDISNHWFIEAGLRYEKQTGKSDVGRSTVDTSSLAPRFSMSYDLSGNGKSIILGTAGRFYEFVTQNLSDAFAQIAPQSNYDSFIWDPAKNQYVFDQRYQSTGNTFTPNLNLKPTYIDEATAGYQQQIGNTMGVGVRGIWRKWHDIIDDINEFNPDGSLLHQVVNYGPARRQYKGLEFTFEKRFSQHWYAAANYTRSEAKGNMFATSTGFSQLGDYLNENCRTNVDVTVGTIPCRTVNDGPNNFGRSPYDRPNDLKAQGAYVFSIGRVNLTAGTSAEWISGISYTPSQTLAVLKPGTTTAAPGLNYTYRYESRGSRRLPSYYFIDGSLEGVVRVWRNTEFGLKGEAFNLTNNQAKISLTNTTWCNNANASSTSTCATQRGRFGTATTRGQFLAPRGYRVTALVRF